MSVARRIAGLTTAALATSGLVVAGLVAPSAAQAPSAVIALTKAVGASGWADTALRPSGRAAVVVNAAGLTKYELGSSIVRRLGTVKIWKQTVPDGGAEVHVHPDGRFAYVVWNRGIRIFDITGSTPRTVRTLPVTGLSDTTINDGAFAPDGSRFYFVGGKSLHVLDSRQPAGPTSGPTTALPAGAAFYKLAVTPNSGAVVLGGSAEGKGALAVYSKGSDAPVLVRQTTVEVPEWTAAGARTSVDDLVARNSSVYVEAGTFGESGESPETAVLQVRRSDLKTLGQIGEDAEYRSPALGATSPAGTLVYLTRGRPSDEINPTSRELVRADAGLGDLRAVPGVGGVVDLAVSPGGSTKGRLVVLAQTSRGLYLELVNAQ